MVFRRNLAEFHRGCWGFDVFFLDLWMFGDHYLTERLGEKKLNPLFYIICFNIILILIKISNKYVAVCNLGKMWDLAFCVFS